MNQKYKVLQPRERDMWEGWRAVCLMYFLFMVSFLTFCMNISALILDCTV